MLYTIKGVIMTSLQKVFTIVILCFVAAIIATFTMPFLGNALRMVNVRPIFDLTIFFMLIVLLKITIDKNN